MVLACTAHSHTVAQLPARSLCSTFLRKSIRNPALRCHSAGFQFLWSWWGKLYLRAFKRQSSLVVWHRWVLSSADRMLMECFVSIPYVLHYFNSWEWAGIIHSWLCFPVQFTENWSSSDLKLRGHNCPFNLVRGHLWVMGLRWRDTEIWISNPRDHLRTFFFFLNMGTNPLELRVLLDWGQNDHHLVLKKHGEGA